MNKKMHKRRLDREYKRIRYGAPTDPLRLIFDLPLKNGRRDSVGAP